MTTFTVPTAASVPPANRAIFDEGNLVDVVMAVGDKIITRHLHALTGVPVDFPAAPAL
jgi:hypothetical protein